MVIKIALPVGRLLAMANAMNHPIAYGYDNWMRTVQFDEDDDCNFDSSLLLE